MKKCRHGHVVRLLEVIDDKLNDRIYMGKHSVSLFSVESENRAVYLLPDYRPWVSVSAEKL
jgi:hypothetical protein